MSIDSRGGLDYIDTRWYIIVPPSGTLLLRRLQVIVISARNQKSDMDKAASYGIEGYVVKPFSLSDLLARIEEVVEKKRILSHV